MKLNNPLIAGVWRNSEFVTIFKILERTKNVGGGLCITTFTTF